MTATKKPTPQIRGQAGRVNEVLGVRQTNVGALCDCTGFSKAQVRLALARLKKLGLAERLAPDVWRCVEAPAAAPLIGVGDRVRWTVDHPGQLITTGTVRDITSSMLGVIDDHGNLRLWAPAHVVRLPDADPTPWDPPKPAPRFSVGDRVFVGFWGCEGEIVEVLRHEYRVRLADGSICFRPHDDLHLLPAKPKPVTAWAHRAGLPVKAGPPTPAETAIMGRGAP